MNGSPSPDEAAAIAAAVERFRSETAPVEAATTQPVGPWQRAALVEGVGGKGGIVDLEGEGGAEWLS